MTHNYAISTYVLSGQNQIASPVLSEYPTILTISPIPVGALPCITPAVVPTYKGLPDVTVGNLESYLTVEFKITLIVSGSTITGLTEAMLYCLNELTTNIAKK